LADDATALSAGSQATLTLDQTLARQMLIDLYSSATGLDAAAAANAASLADIPQELSANSTAQSINSLAATNLRLSAAALLNSTGTAATTTSASNGTSVTALAPTANPTSTDIALALNSSLLGNVDLTAASTGVAGSQTKSTTTNTGTVTNATPPPATTPAAAASTAGNVASPATATTTSSTAIGNASTNSAAANASATAQTTSTLANGFLLDSIAQAATTIERNPAYASAAAGLYLNAMIFHLQHATHLDLANIADSVQPVTAMPAINAVEPI
jgi:hypothetical protein